MKSTNQLDSRNIPTLVKVLTQSKLSIQLPNEDMEKLSTTAGKINLPCTVQVGEPVQQS
jgi:hypothetical protein